MSVLIMTAPIAAKSGASITAQNASRRWSAEPAEWHERPQIFRRVLVMGGALIASVLQLVVVVGPGPWPDIKRQRMTM